MTDRRTVGIWTQADTVLLKARMARFIANCDVIGADDCLTRLYENTTMPVSLYASWSDKLFRIAANLDESIS